MPHTLVTQLRFARSEFARCLEGVSDEEARQRLLPMNSISWMVGHLAAQEQEYFVFFPEGKVPHPRLSQFGFGRPATTPPLAEMWQLWRDITTEADRFLDTLTEEQLLTHLEQDPRVLSDSLFSPVTKEVLARKSIRSRRSLRESCPFCLRISVVSRFWLRFLLLPSGSRVCLLTDQENESNNPSCLSCAVFFFFLSSSIFRLISSSQLKIPATKHFRPATHRQ